MNYRIHENDWTVIVDDFDLNTATQEDANQIARWLATNTLVFFKRQMFDVGDELRLIKMFKDPEAWADFGTDAYENYCVPNTNGLITRVTGEKNHKGETGLAGHVEEMLWHCNQPWKKDRRSLIWLYGVHGTSGSVTTWTNNILAYERLPKDEQDFLKTLKIVPRGGLQHEIAEVDMENIYTTDAHHDVVQTNIAGKVGLFFPFLQIDSFVGMSREESLHILEKYGHYITQPEFCYDHHWEDGDLSIAEQWLGIHKRHRFEKIQNRLLHRAAFDFPDQDYTNIEL